MYHTQPDSGREQRNELKAATGTEGQRAQMSHSEPLQCSFFKHIRVHMVMLQPSESVSNPGAKETYPKHGCYLLVKQLAVPAPQELRCWPQVSERWDTLGGGE